MFPRLRLPLSPRSQARRFVAPVIEANAVPATKSETSAASQQIAAVASADVVLLPVRKPEAPTSVAAKGGSETATAERDQLPPGFGTQARSPVVARTEPTPSGNTVTASATRVADAQPAAGRVRAEPPTTSPSTTNASTVAELPGRAATSQPPASPVQLPVWGAPPPRPATVATPTAAAPLAAAPAPGIPATPAPKAPPQVAAAPRPASQTITDRLAAQPLPEPGATPVAGAPALIGQALASPTFRAAIPAPPPRGASAARLSFARGSSDLPENIGPTLAGLADRLRSDPSLHLAVVAFAQNSGSDDGDARRISLNRAVAVRNYLISQRVSLGQLDMKAQGDRFATGEPGDRVDLIMLER